MGIVMCLVMAISLLLIRPMRQFNFNPLVARPIVFKVFAILVLLGGCWNALWYGLSHLNSFWGNAALGSGALTILTAVFVLSPINTVKGEAKLQAVVKVFEWLLSAGLLAFLMLYIVTIVRLNLGFSIL